jgi:hypothetical protein
MAVVCRSWLGTSLDRGVEAGSFAHIAALVAGGSIKIIELQAVPRSLSTALVRCLNESGVTSLLINEPFNVCSDDVTLYDPEYDDAP